MNNRYIQIDEEGYFAFDGQRVTDAAVARAWLESMQPTEDGRFTVTIEGQPVWVENFDAPLVALHIRKIGYGQGAIDLPYGGQAQFSFGTLTVDEWDRFHGRTDKNVPFVLSRAAQMELFDAVDEFDDDSITVDGERHPVEPWLNTTPKVSNDTFWSERYKNQETGWDLNREAPALAEFLPRLKLSRQRIAVLGCGAGHDAAFLAKQGHTVTGFDFSNEAISRAVERYGSIEGLQFQKADVFALPESMNGRFDLIFEHTCYCAVTPERRSELVNVWRRLLTPRGHVLGIFFVMEKPAGPPFGGSEWEIRQRLKAHFDFLYWLPVRNPAEGRGGRELLMYAERRS